MRARAQRAIIRRVRGSLLFVLFLVGCQPTPEKLLERIAAAHEDYELVPFYERSRAFLERFPDHPERDRVRYQLAEQMIATTLLNPGSPRAIEARLLLDRAREDAKTKAARFDAALLLLKFTPNLDIADAKKEARAMLDDYEGHPDLDQVYFWIVARLEEDGDTKAAADFAEELLQKYPKIASRQEYEAIVRRARIVGKRPPFDDATAAELADRIQGKVVLIDFWATWCAPCVAALPKLRSFYEAHGGGEAFEVVGISLDEDTDAYERFAEDNELVGVQLRSVGDDGLDERFGVRRLPAYLIVGKDGMVHHTALSGDALFAELERLLR